MCCPCCAWADFTDGDNTLRYYNNGVLCTCCYDWTVDRKSKNRDFETVGSLHSAGCCDNGCMWCACRCFVCNHPNLMIAKFFVKDEHSAFSDSGDPAFTLRRDVACGDSCLFAMGLLCYPCLGPCNWCCKYCSGKTAQISFVPFWGKDGTVKESGCLLYTSPSPRDRTRSRMPSSA
eukprot:TRINITY_DN3134_c0_g1_i2.p1 TRINITY_DN3134_c0_g1~~TRINITY_DN3134_c0_g1_i2.p1  ORF type:complete len:176 (-),score=56.11 TRINITY_DN3134_c0_g1_i2:71-598(-)